MAQLQAHAKQHLEAATRPPGANAQGAAHSAFLRIFAQSHIFYASNGYLAIGDEDVLNGYRSYIGPDMPPWPTGHTGGDRFANFIDAVRSRKKEDLHAPIEEGHISCTLVHLAHAFYRLGRTLNFDPKAEQVICDAEANRLLRDTDRGYRRPFVIPERV